MNQQTREILTIMQEECAEIIVGASKCIRFGLHDKEPETKETNINRLNKEIGDLLAMIDLLIDQKLVTKADLEEYSKQKIDKLKKFSNLKLPK